MFSGIEVKFKNMVYPVILAPAFIPELNTVTHTEGGEYCHQTLQPRLVILTPSENESETVIVSLGLGVMFGAACTLSHMGAVLKQAVETLPPHQTEVFLAVLEQLRWFAGLQIRNVAVRLLLRC